MTRLTHIKRHRPPIVRPAAPPADQPVEPPVERNLADPSSFRTPLGRLAAELRAQIVASGVPLLDWEGIRRERANRASGYPDDDDQPALP